MVPGSLPDITPNSAATPLTSNQDLQATVVVLTATGTTIRVGGPNVSATEGAVLPSGVPVVLPSNEFVQGLYPLARIFVYGSGSDKVSIATF